MARHNREGRGSDQRGAEYLVSYQPDWLNLVKVTRDLENGRQSTKTVLRNPGWREQAPGAKVRTRITSPKQGLDFEVAIDDPRGVIRRVIIETVLPGSDAEGEGEVVIFTVEDRLPPPPPPVDPPDDDTPVSTAVDQPGRIEVAAGGA
jgi:hypothetical protein